MKKGILLATLGAIAVLAIAPWAFLTATGFEGFSWDLGPACLIWGRFAGILAMVAFLFQWLSMGKKRTFDGIGKPAMIRWHRWLGFASAGLVVLHLALICVGRMVAYDQGFTDVIGDFLHVVPWGYLTVVGTLAFCLVWITAACFTQKKMKFPPFQKWHRLIWVGILCVIPHQLIMGVDFANSLCYRIIWFTLIGLVFIDFLIAKIRLLRQA